MRWFTNIRYRLKATFAPSRMEQEMDEEMTFHLDMEVRKLVNQGLSPGQARRRALQNFGEPIRQKERARRAWGINLVQDLRSDTRLTLRGFQRSPVFTIVAAVTLALGIGGATAIFSVVNGVLLTPLPYRDPGELVSVHHAMNTASISAVPLSPALYFTFRDHGRTLQDIAIFRERPVTVTGGERPERVDALEVTDRFFPVLGIGPLIGRGYGEEDVSPGSTNPVILTHPYWQQRFGGDPAILGQTIRINGRELEIVAVMPPDFRLPERKADLFLPLVFDRARIGIGNFSFPGIARLRPGFTVDDSSRELNALTPLASEEYGGIPLADLRAREFVSFVRPLRDTLVGSANTALWVVFGTVGLVLLIACANVANLFLVRAETRQRDVALRAAMGASRWRLTRQFLTESLSIGLIGGAVGVFLAAGGIRFLLYLAPLTIPRLENIALDTTVLAFALCVSLLTGLLFGSIPALRAGKGSLAGPLKDGGRGTVGGRRRFRLRTVFAVSQVAMALILLVGSGLMIRSFQALRGVPPGFDNSEEVLTLRVSVPSSEVEDVDQGAVLQQTILQRVAQLPGVVSASGAASVGMEGWESWDDWEVEEFPLAPGVTAPNRRMNWMVPGYFETVQNPLLAGRSLEWDDIYERRNVLVVTENFAREYWGEPNRALGKRIRNSSSSPWREIVGVVGDVYTRGVANDAPLVVFLPYITANFWGAEAFSVRELRYVVRTTRPDPRSLLPQIREVVSSADPNLALADVLTLDQIFGQSIARTSFTLAMLGIAAGVALVLGLVGVYGVVSYIVAQRTKEMGVRIALGATRKRVSLMVLKQGSVLGTLGVVVGLGLSTGLTRVMEALLFGVSPVDPLTYGAVSAALVAVVLLASYLPARRAAEVDPTQALRGE